MTDDERELHIRDCGCLIESAYKAGNHEEAKDWLQVMNQAIAARSPAQVEKMEQALNQRIHEPCYFATKGEEDRDRFLRRQAA